MLIYTPWIEIADTRGEYNTVRFSAHTTHKGAVDELYKKLEGFKKEDLIIVIKKGIDEIEVIE